MRVTKGMALTISGDNYGSKITKCENPYADVARGKDHEQDKDDRVRERIRAILSFFLVLLLQGWYVLKTPSKLKHDSKKKVERP